MDQPEATKIETQVMRTASLIAGVILWIAGLYFTLRIAAPLSLEYAGPFGVLAVAAFGIVVLAFFGVGLFRLLRKII